MDKLKLHTPDFTSENVTKLAELFPNCVTEARDERGTLKRVIDFDLLQQELSGTIVEGARERYHLDWPGKREAVLAANAPIAKTLRPYHEESVDFDTTKNLFIEGDNLDALKLLQETYINKIKMIYIDPPYNTGNDFVYDDDFSEDTNSYFERSNQTDDLGTRLVANTEANGRFHSDWLTMVYPRLKLSRTLLAKDGVIFISIDDNECARLKIVCDEVFGSDNFITCFAWQKTLTRRNDATFVSSAHEYILAYARDMIPIADSGPIPIAKAEPAVVGHRALRVRRIQPRCSARCELRGVEWDTCCGVTAWGADGPARRSGPVDSTWLTGPPPNSMPAGCRRPQQVGQSVKDESASADACGSDPGPGAYTSSPINEPAA